jgi:hypothetical protein
MRLPWINAVACDAYLWQDLNISLRELIKNIVTTQVPKDLRNKGRSVYDASP